MSFSAASTESRISLACAQLETAPVTWRKSGGGARPSSGTIMWKARPGGDSPVCSEHPWLAAPGDGRTPAGAVSRYARLAGGKNPAFFVRFFRVARTVGCAVWLALLLPAIASQPVISKIELFSTNQVLIHFDTEANRTYTLQYTLALKGTNGAASSWSNLYVAPNFPFSDHYVIVDTRTNKARFYRLQASP